MKPWHRVLINAATTGLIAGLSILASVPAEQIEKPILISATIAAVLSICYELKKADTSGTRPKKKSADTMRCFLEAAVFV